MDFESILAVVLCALAVISIAVLVIRRIKENRATKKAAKEAAKSVSKKTSEKRKPEEKASEKTKASRVRTDAEEKAFEKPKETPAKTTVSRVKTDPAFSEKKAPEKPKQKKATPKSDMETETLLRVEKGKRDYWKCYYCGTENNKSHGRCVVCTQEKPSTGV